MWSNFVYYWSITLYLILPIYNTLRWLHSHSHEKSVHIVRAYFSRTTLKLFPAVCPSHIIIMFRVNSNRITYCVSPLSYISIGHFLFVITINYCIYVYSADVFLLLFWFLSRNRWAKAVKLHHLHTQLSDLFNNEQSRCETYKAHVYWVGKNGKLFFFFLI